MSIEAESVAVKEEIKIKEECDDELLDILPSTSKLIPEDDKEAIQASLKIDPEQDLKLLAGTSHGDSEYDCFEEKQFKMENVEPTEGTTSEDEDQSDSESEDLSDEGPPKIKSEELIIKSESAVDSDARPKRKVVEYACNLCSYVTKYKYSFKRHDLLIHHKELAPIFPCNFCEFKTNQKGTLKYHVLVRHESGSVKKHACDICSYKTHRRNSLKEHKRVHNRNRPKNLLDTLKNPFSKNNFFPLQDLV